jgi:putative addiction module component (TIGR02574 family)
MSAIKDIEQAVLALPVAQRVQLAEALLESLPPAGNELSEADELAEVERHERQIECGEIRPISEEEFWQRIAARRKR